jgi:hypothetical protein
MNPINPKLFVATLVFLILSIGTAHKTYAQHSPRSFETTLEWLKEKIDTFGYVPENFCDFYICSLHGIPYDSLIFRTSKNNRVTFNYDINKTLIFLNLHFDIEFDSIRCTPNCKWIKDTIDVNYVLDLTEIYTMSYKNYKNELPNKFTQAFGTYQSIGIYTKTSAFKRSIASSALKLNKESKGKFVYGFDILNEENHLLQRVLRALKYAVDKCPEKENSKF